MIDPRLSPRFVGIRSFARQPVSSPDADGAAAAVIGLPFDTTTVFRPGARFGPAAIRDASVLLRNYTHDAAHPVLERLGVVDCGDCAVVPGNTERSHELIERAVAEIVAAGAMPLGLGGDHSVTLPELRAVAARHGPVGLLQLDAHTDTDDSYFGERFTHGSSFARAAEEGLLDPGRVVQVGLRGSLFASDDYEIPRGLGFETIPATAIDERGLDDTIARIADRLGDGPVFVTVDVDVLDPSCAPGTGMPEIGGLTTREVQRILRSLAPLDLVGCDVVELLPSFDPTQITAIAAANIAFELLAAKAAG